MNLRHSFFRTLSLLLLSILVLGGTAGCTRAQETGSDSSISTTDKAEGDIIGAAAAGNVAVVKRLIESGADTESKNAANGSTPLIAACVMGRTEVVRVLIEADADLEAKNNEQTTPLYNAAFFGHPVTVELLLESGADIDVTDKNGTPLVDVMGAPWEAVRGIYQVIFPLVGLDFDEQKIQTSRTIIHAMLIEKLKSSREAMGSVLREGTQAEIEAIREGLPRISAADWSSYNHDVKGWRFNSAEHSISPDNASTLKEKWRFPGKASSEKVGAIHATPIVVNGHVYFGTARFPAFYKLKPDGTLAWVFRIPENDAPRELPQGGVNRIEGSDGVVASALVTDKAVYFGNSAGIFFALDRVTGKEKWRVNTRKEGFPNHHTINTFNASAILADGKVIVGGGGYEHPYPLDPEYQCCTGRGFVVAFDPDSGDVVWKYEVGDEPKKYPEPIAIEDDNGKHVFTHGPSTSSVWSTPSYDEATGTIFFGTDVHNSPRQPTEDDPRLYTEYSAAVIAVDVETGKEKWVTQVNAGDIFNHTMSGYDSRTGRYKDCSIGDTPKVYNIEVNGHTTSVVGAGCKNGGFYVMRADNGEIVCQTPVYSGEPKYPLSPPRDPRLIALPSAIGGIQTGCATDGTSIFTNGLDWLSLSTKKPTSPEAGRVVCLSTDLKTESWRHERPKIRSIFYTGGDPVAAGIAIGGGLACFAPAVSEKLVVLNSETGQVVKELPTGPLWTGPSISRGRVYVGTGSVMFLKQQETGSLISFGLPGEDEVDRMGKGNE
jgi:polyvinyl alcohol dehydrogenase (cytochrome)